MTIKEFKDKLAEEIRNKLRKNNTPTPILDRLELHVKDFEGVSVQDIIGSKNMRHDVYVSFIYQICYPSRIKMDIDENYQPITKKRIAIVSCKSKKQDYACSADEMYGKSHAYIAQRAFFTKAYDEYFIFSSEYGLTPPNQIIKPYNRIVGTRLHQKSSNIKHGYEQSTIDLVVDQIEYLINKNCIVDFHTSKAYFDPLPKSTQEKVNYIKQPHGINLIKPRYEEAYTLLDNKPLEECLKFIGHKTPKPKNLPINWYHPIHETFYGTAWQLYMKYKGILKIHDAGLSHVRYGDNLQHRGWVIDKTHLDNMYQTDSGQWRIKKQK